MIKLLVACLCSFIGGVLVTKLVDRDADGGPADERPQQPPASIAAGLTSQRDFLALLQVADPQERVTRMLGAIDSLDEAGCLSALTEVRRRMNRISPPEEVTVFKAILERYASFSVPSALDYVKSLSKTDIKNQAAQAIMRRWAQSDLEAATAYLNEDTSDLAMMGGRARADSARVMAEQLVAEDMGTVAEWIEKLNDRVLDVSVRAVANKLVLDDPLQAAAFVDATETSDKKWLIGRVAWDWSKQDPEAALDWVRKESEVENLDDGLRHVIAGWADKDPGAAATFIDGLENPPTEFVDTLIGEWFKTAPTEAANWLDSTPESIQVPGTGTLVKRWAALQPEETSAWLAKQPNGSPKDAGITELARVLVSTDPEASMDWSSTITDQAHRQKILLQISSKWKARNSDAFQVWLSTTTRLGDQDKSMIE